MELRQLEFVVAAAEELHFGRAAERLRVSQPTVSQQIAHLERELGTPLFDRAGRGVRLTSAGERFLPQARATLAAAEHARSAVGPPGGHGTLRIGTSSGMGERLDRVLLALRDGDPPLETELVSTSTRSRLDRVRTGRLDAAFVRGDVGNAAGLELLQVWDDQLLVALPAGSAAARPPRVELSALAGYALQLVPRSVNPPLVDLVLTACATAGFEPLMSSGEHSLQNTLAQIGSGAQHWTVIFAAHAATMRVPQVAFRRVSPELLLTTWLAVRADATSRSMAPLLRACAQAARELRTDSES
ncbi:LysR family transcriptional regulator [Nakamurella lactea]|uniref:LysR family transcriptional regulator n=1 Tax=Nakamurella lactea TaxID=459515 RepID=UPI00040CCB4E|nr:LysR family transcriptional regulator [Nakamurella lactea]